MGLKSLLKHKLIMKYNLYFNILNVEFFKC